MDFGQAQIEDLQEALKRNEDLLVAARSPIADILRSQIESRRQQAIANLVYKEEFAQLHFLRGALSVLDELSKLVDTDVIEHSSAEIHEQLRMMRESL